MEVHLCYEKEKFAGEQCVRVFGKDPDDLDVFLGVMCLDRAQGHLIFRKDDLWSVLQRLLKFGKEFSITGS